MDGMDVAIGMTVQYREGFGSEPRAAIVTKVNYDRISVVVFDDMIAQPIPRDAVLHSSHPEARKHLERNDDSGIWDYVQRQQPPEIDRSKMEAKPVPARSAKTKQTVSS